MALLISEARAHDGCVAELTCQHSKVYSNQVIPRRLILSKYGWFLPLVQRQSGLDTAKLSEYREYDSLP